MSRAPDDPPSFDPATWLKPAPGAAPPPPPSFDPRSWAGAPGFAAPPEPATPVAAAPHRVAAIIGAGTILLAGAVAALMTRPPAVPVAIAPQRAVAVPDAPVLARRTLVLDGAGALEGALAANGLPAAEAAAVAASARAMLPAAGEIRAVLSIDERGGATRFARLEASYPDGSGAVVTRGDDGRLAAARVAAQLHSAVRVVRGEMDADSFYSSAVAAGVSDSLIPDFAQAFAFDFDFQREVKQGDVFEAAFEQPLNPAGEPVGAPRLVYASLQTPQKSRALYRFAPPGEAEGWFDGNGRSIVRSLMRTPVDGARVSSTFGMRVHPVLGFTKMHNGIDFAAPVGTPIYASGDGTVEVANPSETAGNWCKIRHTNGWLTVYMHMNRYMPGIAVGAHVRQGQQIGEIGTTGRSTGPHLHYELRIKDDEPVDPMSVPTEQGHALAGPALAAFLKARDRIDVSRAAQAN